MGPNGVGKSTLLSILAGTLQPDDGVVERRPSNARVGLLSQEPRRSSSETVHDYLARRTGVSSAQSVLDHAIAALAAGEIEAEEHYSAALTRCESVGAIDLDSRIGLVFADLDLTPALLERSTSLSPCSPGKGGEMLVASVLLSRFDLLLLNEPTDDLDVDSLERLEQWVLALETPLLLTSHDRRFLARVTTDVVEIDHYTHEATRFAGGWTAYIHERDVARKRAQRQFEEYDRNRQALLRRAQQEQEWAQQGVSRARRSNDRDKGLRAARIQQAEQLARRAARTERVADRLDAVEEPHDPGS